MLKQKTGGAEFIPEQRSMGNETQLFLHSQIQQAGFYHVMKGETVYTTLAFNYRRDESNLEYYSEKELEKIAIQSQVRISVVPAQTTDLARTISETLNGVALWRYFLMIALTCFFVEILLLRLWGRAKMRK